jgi:outer membrane PBP1 activator LpoA protein
VLIGSTPPRTNSCHQKTAMARPLIALLFALAAVLPLGSMAQERAPLTDLQALRSAAADRKALVTSTLQLSEAEAKKFWPLYAAYQRSREAADRQRVRALESLIATGTPISDAYARNLSTELLQADEAELRARRTLHNALMRALPAKKAAQYLQLESKLRAIQSYDIAGSVPLIK